MVNTYGSEAKSRKPNGRISRGDRARFLFETGKVHPTGTPGHWTVTSETNPSESYRVEIAANGNCFCSCRDFFRAIEKTHSYKEAHCKHLMAAALHRAACKSGFRPSVAA